MPTEKRCKPGRTFKDLRSQRPLAGCDPDLQGGDGAVRFDGRSLVTLERDGLVRWWSPATGKQTRKPWQPPQVNQEIRSRRVAGGRPDAGDSCTRRTPGLVRPDQRSKNTPSLCRSPPTPALRRIPGRDRSAACARRLTRCNGSAWTPSRRPPSPSGAISGFIRSPTARIGEWCLPGPAGRTAGPTVC